MESPETITGDDLLALIAASEEALRVDRELAQANKLAKYKPQVDPDPANPCTPPFLFFRARYNAGIVAVWRKRTNAWTFTTRGDSSSRPSMYAFHEWDSQMGEDAVEWVPLKWRSFTNDSYAGVRRVQYDRYSTRGSRAACDHGLMSPEPGDTTVMFHGMTCSNAYSFSRAKANYKQWAVEIRNALDGYDDLNWGRQRDQIDDLKTFSGGISGGSMKAKFVSAVNEAFSNVTGDGDVLVHCSCGDVEFYGEEITDHRGNSYCGSCANDLREIDGEMYSEDDCYYWGSDGEYHTEEEPEDDDYTPSSDYIESWGRSTDCMKHDRSFEPSPAGDLLMGIELEVESNRNSFSEAVDDTHYHFNGESQYAMFKRDGSLSDSGFEIVTAARKLGDHIEKFSTWSPHSSLRAWDPGTCGLHVHIDSRGFNALTLGKFLMLINEHGNKGLIKRIAGRHPLDGGNAQSYCAASDQSILENPSKALKGNHTSRYRMVNLCNLGYEERGRLKVTNVERDCKGSYSTIELRIFRGTLRKERLLAQLEFTHAAIMFCRTASWSQLNEGAFKSWLTTMAGTYKSLAHWYGINVPKAKPGATASRRVDETSEAA